MKDFDAITGRELDALVAERIMGWKLDPTCTAEDGSPFVLKELSRFSANERIARNAMRVVEHLHPGTRMSQESQSPYKVVVHGPSGRDYTGQDESQGVAMCRAMLKVMRGEGPGVRSDKRSRQRRPRARGDNRESGGRFDAALQNGDEDALRALAKWVSGIPPYVPYLAQQAAGGKPEIAGMCVATLGRLVNAGNAARTALDAATEHSNPDVAKAAREALDGS